MRKYLLPKNGSLYRANLHTHSTVSDGKLSPEQLKEIYKAHGYSVVAFTDHRIHIRHDELTDSEFVALSGVEYDVDAADRGQFRRKCCHICMIALDTDNTCQPCYNIKYGDALVNPKYHALVNPNGDLPSFDISYEDVSAIMQRGRDCGFFVTYNHPYWSMENFNDYTNYHGMHAMEISNYGCIVMGYPEYNPQIYDHILHGGERIFAVAADDNHNHHPQGTKKCDSFGGYTMIKADNLDYKSITDALCKGNFYAVTGDGGADIEEMWYEDRKLHVKCTDAHRVMVVTGRGKAYTVNGAFDEPITEAEFNIHPDDIYIRVSITDAHGNHTDSNAYFLDTL